MESELSVNYMGLELASPVIVGACPLTIEPETVRQLVGAGAGAIVLPSMLQEQIEHRNLGLAGAGDQSGCQSQHDKYNGGVENYLYTIASLAETCRAPIIGSLSGSSTGDWLDYAQELESAGADALEFNVQSANFDPEATSDAVEARLCELVAGVVQRVSIPVAVKMTQRFTSLASMARQIQQAGAKGLVLFAHLPHWDVCTDRMHWTIRWELSPLDSLGGILEGIVRVHIAKLELAIAASGGIATSEDAVKTMIAGADVVMITSAVYREGPDAIRNMLDGIQRHLDSTHHPTLRDFQSARPNADQSPQQMMQLEYVDPLTRSKTYYDPTPAASHCAGDAYGHVKG